MLFLHSLAVDAAVAIIILTHFNRAQSLVVSSLVDVGVAAIAPPPLSTTTDNFNEFRYYLHILQQNTIVEAVCVRYACSATRKRLLNILIELLMLHANFVLSTQLILLIRSLLTGIIRFVVIGRYRQRSEFHFYLAFLLIVCVRVCIAHAVLHSGGFCFWFGL